MTHMYDTNGWVDRRTIFQICIGNMVSCESWVVSPVALSTYIYIHDKCIYIYLRTHIYIYTRLYIYTYIYMYMYIFTYVYIYTYMYPCVYVYIYIHIYIHIYLHTYEYIYTFELCPKRHHCTYQESAIMYLSLSEISSLFGIYIDIYRYVYIHI